MIKARAWPVRAMYMLIAAALAISLIITAAPALKVSADPGLSEWDRVITPSEDDWVLAPNTTILDYAVADDGEVAFAIVVDWDTIEFLLLKSTDHAATWKDITDALEEVIDIDGGDAIIALIRVATDNVDPDFVAVALEWFDQSAGGGAGANVIHVFISTDGGSTFQDTGEVEDGGVSFPNWMNVTDLAVSPEVGGRRDIAIVGSDATPTALVFRCTAYEDHSGAWEDATDTSDFPGWDDESPPGPPAFTSMFVTDVKFAPSWAEDNTILVVTVAQGTTNFDVYLQSGIWGKTAQTWNEDADFEPAVLVKDEVVLPLLGVIDNRGTAGVTLPLDYAGEDPDYRFAWVWVNYFDPVHDYGPCVGEILRVRDNAVDPVDTQVAGMPWLTNVSYLGHIDEGKAIAGLLGTGCFVSSIDEIFTDCCEGVQVYRNDEIADMEICCLEWDNSCKPPTGRGPMAAFYVSNDPATSKAYAVSLLGAIFGPYDEDAWSVSVDDGYTWNQLSLIDTYIDYLSDVAVSPDCNKTMLVSVNLQDMSLACNCTPAECTGCDSVWLHAEDLPEAEEYSGKWVRTWCGMLEGDNDDEIPGDQFAERGLLRLAPEETGGDTVYLVDRMTNSIYWNEWETWACWKTRSSTASLINQIIDLAVKDESTIYALDENGDVAMSDDHAAATSWTEAVNSKVENGWTIAVRGDDVIVGGQEGDVSHSDDDGETFTALEDIATSGYVTVAFDSYFDANDTIYAALANADDDNGVYRLVIIEDAENAEWTDLRAEPLESQIGLPVGGVDNTVEVHFTGLVLDRPSPGNPMTSADTGGVLYASFFIDYGTNSATGVARYLTPAEDVVCKECGDWDYLVEGLKSELFNMMPHALKICGCLTADTNSNLFAIDGSEPYDMEKAKTGTVWTFEDCYAKKAPDLTSPADGATIAADPCFCVNVPFTLGWDRLCDACSYDIQIALDEDFTDILWDSLTQLGESYVPPAGDAPTFAVDGILTCEFTYYWRVRGADAETGQIIHSWWSDPRSVTIAPALGAGVKLISPEAGATDVATTNIGFSWSEVGSADEYDWKLSANADLSSPIATQTGLTNAACQYSGTALDYDTSHYWQVTALKDGDAISTSAVGTFRTMEEPPTDGPPPVEETPIWVWVVIAIGAVLVIVVIVLIFRTRRV